MQETNAISAVLLEAINLGTHVDASAPFVLQSVIFMGFCVQSRETNMRYLGLETLTRLAMYPSCAPNLAMQHPAILATLNDKDMSVRRRALDLVFTICNDLNVVSLVAELMKCLGSTDYTSKEEIVLKISIMTEKYATDLEWYLETMLQLIAMAGDHVSGEIGFRVVRVLFI